MSNPWPYPIAPVLLDSKPQRRHESEGTVVLGSETDYADLSRLADEGALSRIVVADLDVLQDRDAAQALIDLKLRGVKIERAPDLFERANQKIWIEGLSAEALIFANGFSVSSSYRSLKRAFDLIASIVLLI